MKPTTASYERFLANIAAHAGFREIDESEGTAQAVIAVLIKSLPTVLRYDLVDALPDVLLNAAAKAPSLESDEEPDAFFRAVAATENLPVGFAKEHVLVVCQALVDFLPPELLRRIRNAVSDDMRSKFRPRESFSPPPRGIREERHTISSGRPGGTHPLSEATGREDSIASGRPGGKRPLSEAHPEPPARRIK